MIIDILDEALKGANKTRIMYRANMNFLRFERYFGELLNTGLIVVADNPSVSGGCIIYQTSEKGRELLAKLKEAHKIISL